MKFQFQYKQRKNRRRKYVQDLRLTWVKRGGVIIPNSYSWDYYTSLIVPGYSSNHEVLLCNFALCIIPWEASGKKKKSKYNVYINLPKYGNVSIINEEDNLHCHWYFSLIDPFPGAILKRDYCMYNIWQICMVQIWPKKCQTTSNC